MAAVVKLSKMGLGQDEQLHNCNVSVDMYNCLYCTVQLPGSSLASVEVSLTLWKNLGQTTKHQTYMDKIEPPVFAFMSHYIGQMD